ncbi:MAG: polysaccharide deacetylase family protein, partial [Lactococcus lactis]
NISKKVVQEDYQKSQKAFGEKLDQKGKVFAYPYGAQNKDLEDYMLQDGIQGIFTLSPGVVTNETLYSNIPRLIVTKDNWKTIKHWLLSEGTQ